MFSSLYQWESEEIRLHCMRQEESVTVSLDIGFSLVPCKGFGQYGKMSAAVSRDEWDSYPSLHLQAVACPRLTC